MVRAFAVLTPVLVALAGGLVCRYGGRPSERALGRPQARLLLLCFAVFAWLVSAMVLAQAVRAVEPSGITALAGSVIDLGSFGPVVLELQWSADALSLAAAAAVYVVLLARSMPAVMAQARAGFSASPAPLDFDGVGHGLMLLAGAWALVLCHSVPAMVLVATLLVFGEGSPEPVSRRVSGGWSIVGWFAFAAVTVSPGKPPSMTTLALVSAAGQRSALVRTEVAPWLSYADVATVAAVVALAGLAVGRKTRTIAAPLLGVLVVHLNGTLALSEWGMAALVVAGCALLGTTWVRGVERVDAAAYAGAGLVLACAGMGQFVDAYWVGLATPFVVALAAQERPLLRVLGLGLGTAVWGPAAVMATVGASVGSVGINVLLGLVCIVAFVGLGARTSARVAAQGSPTPRAGARLWGPMLAVALAGIGLARWLGPLTEPLRRLVAVSAQFEGPLALGVLPFAQGWGPGVALGLGVSLMALAWGAGLRFAPSFSIAVRPASPVHALATLVRAGLAIAHGLGVEVRNRWWGWRTAATPGNAPRTRVRQIAWAFAAVMGAAFVLHGCPSGSLRSATYDTPGLSPRLLAPRPPRALQEGEP